MTYDHRFSTIHRAELDREIDSIRNERMIAASVGEDLGLVGRARRGTGRVLIAAGTALAGRDTTSLRASRS